MKDRIHEVMDSLHMSQQTFAQFIDISAASLSSIFNGRTRPTLNIVEAIKKKVPDISTDWLMFGTGSMYQSSSAPDSTTPSPHEEPTLDFGVASAPTQPDLFQEPQEHHGVKNTPSREVIKIVDKQERKITEIRVYFDDLTYESFVPAKK